jgi:hypothetical protein
VPLAFTAIGIGRGRGIGQRIEGRFDRLGFHSITPPAVAGAGPQGDLAVTIRKYGLPISCGPIRSGSMSFADMVGALVGAPLAEPERDR